MAQTVCDSVNYWIGSTTERFTISDSLINETSDLTINPNSGFNSGATQLDFIWITNNFTLVNKFVFRGEITKSITTITGDVHVLIILPTDLTISNMGEIVFGTLVPMRENFHYDSFAVSNGASNYNIFYIRDLTGYTLPQRQFQFDISIA